MGAFRAFNIKWCFIYPTTSAGNTRNVFDAAHFAAQTWHPENQQIVFQEKLIQWHWSTKLYRCFKSLDNVASTKESRVSCLSTSGCRLTNLVGLVFFLTGKVFFLPWVSSLPGMVFFLPWYETHWTISIIQFPGWKGPVVIFPEVHFAGQGMRVNPQGAIPLLKGSYSGQHRGSINLEYRKDPKHKEKLSRYLFFFSNQV